MSPRIDEGREWIPDVIERRGRGGRRLPGPLPRRVSVAESLLIGFALVICGMGFLAGWWLL